MKAGCHRVASAKGEQRRDAVEERMGIEEIEVVAEEIAFVARQPPAPPNQSPLSRAEGARGIKQRPSDDTQGHCDGHLLPSCCCSAAAVMSSSTDKLPKTTVDDTAVAGPSHDTDGGYHSRDPNVVGECDVCVLEDQRLFYIQ